jgi:hypothetical protein
VDRRGQADPGRQALGRPELRHVATGLGDEALRSHQPDTRDGAQQLKLPRGGHHPDLELGVDAPKSGLGLLQFGCRCPTIAAW